VRVAFAGVAGAASVGNGHAVDAARVKVIAILPSRVF